jgi:hypothetical protein
MLDHTCCVFSANMRASSEAICLPYEIAALHQLLDFSDKLVDGGGRSPVRAGCASGPLHRPGEADAPSARSKWYDGK